MSGKLATVSHAANFKPTRQGTERRRRLLPEATYSLEAHTLFSSFCSVCLISSTDLESEVVLVWGVVQVVGQQEYKFVWSSCVIEGIANR